MKKNKVAKEQIVGSFEDIIKASVSGNPTPKPKKKKSAKKKSS